MDIGFLLEQLDLRNKQIFEEFEVIRVRLNTNALLQKLHSENFTFSKKYMKRHIRIFDALKRLLFECDAIYLTKNSTNRIESLNHITSLLDDIVPILSRYLSQYDKPVGNFDHNNYSTANQNHFHEEFPRTIDDIYHTQEHIGLFLRMWMDIIKTPNLEKQFLVYSDNILLDMLVIKSNLQEFIEMRKESAR